AYVVDEDEFWYQTWRRAGGQPGKWSTIEVSLDASAGDLLPVAHARPWGPYVARGVCEIGVRVFADRPTDGTILLDNIRFVPRSGGRVPQRVYGFETNSDRVGRFEKFEITFELTRSYDNPFDPDEVATWGHFTSPSGKTVRVPGFFYQEYGRQMSRKSESLTPAGAPKWKIRFSPREVGEYTYEIEISDGDPLRTSPRRFTCIPSGNPGCVRICARDKRYFEFDNGDFFYPIGHNICAAFDDCHSANWRLPVNRFEGTYAYDRYLDGMLRGKENY
ncbi:unnamed protein product, partial [marine sediment metagenome]